MRRPVEGCIVMRSIRFLGSNDPNEGTATLSPSANTSPITPASCSHSNVTSCGSRSRRRPNSSVSCFASILLSHTLSIVAPNRVLIRVLTTKLIVYRELHKPITPKLHEKNIRLRFALNAERSLIIGDETNRPSITSSKINFLLQFQHLAGLNLVGVAQFVESPQCRSRHTVGTGY